MNVLFLCTGNSCRSILGEAIFNHLAPAGWKAMSAGSHPTGTVHPRSLALLAGLGIPTAGCHSKSWDELALPLTALQQERTRLQTELDRIGTLKET
jgi:arsenate reductase